MTTNPNRLPIYINVTEYGDLKDIYIWISA